MRDPVSRFAAWTADARAERRDSFDDTRLEMDNLDGRSVHSLVRLRAARIVRLVLSIAAVPVGWILAQGLPGVLPIFALALCLGGLLNSIVTVYLVVHVQKAIRGARYEASFAARDTDEG